MDGGAGYAAVHGVAKSRTRLIDFPFIFHFHALEKEMASHSSVLAWRIPGMGEPGGLPSMGSHRLGHDWSDLAAAAAVLWALLIFQICWHTECSTLTTSSFRIWDSSAGILSCPLALFIVILSNTQLTSHSRMPGSRRVITPSWLSGSLWSFFCIIFLCIVVSFS